MGSRSCSHALKPAVEAGNEVAIDAVLSLVKDESSVVRYTAVDALKEVSKFKRLIVTAKSSMKSFREVR